MPTVPDRRFRFHECAQRWLPLVPGLRTVALTLVGAGLMVPLVWRVVHLADAYVAEGVVSLAYVAGPLFLLYPLSKVATGLRGWLGEAAGGGTVPEAGSGYPGAAEDYIDGVDIPPEGY